MPKGTVATTATLAGFRREDISFHNARRQSEIENEIGKEQLVKDEVEVPVSTTPEQLIAYFRDCVEQENDRDKRHLYSQAAKYIERMLVLEQKLIKYKIKEVIEEHNISLEAVEVDD